MVSLKDIGLVINADGSDTPIHHSADGHYGPTYKVLEGKVRPIGPQSRGLDITKATDYR